MKKPNIFVVGQSGSGKSTSLRNLDPARTIILNTEQKQLPFKGAGKFKRMAMIPSFESFQKYFADALTKADADVIVLESFTSLCEMIMMKAKKIHTGWDVRNYFNDKVFELVLASKNTEKYVVFIGIDETVDSIDGIAFRQVKIDGKQLKGIEKEFVITLFTVPREDNGKVVYEFVTGGDVIRSAKSPMEMLPEKMPNDLAEIIKLSEQYYTGE